MQIYCWALTVTFIVISFLIKQYKRLKIIHSCFAMTLYNQANFMFVNARLKIKLHQLKHRIKGWMMQVTVCWWIVLLPHNNLLFFTFSMFLVFGVLWFDVSRWNETLIMQLLCNLALVLCPELRNERNEWMRDTQGWTSIQTPDTCDNW